MIIKMKAWKWMLNSGRRSSTRRTCLHSINSAKTELLLSSRSTILHQHTDKDEKSGELGELVRVNFFPTLCYFSAYQHFTPIYDTLSHCFANIRRFALIFGVLIDIFYANFAEANISCVLICTFFSCLLRDKTWPTNRKSYWYKQMEEIDLLPADQWPDSFQNLSVLTILSQCLWLQFPP